MKIPRDITHERRLAASDEQLQRCASEVSGLRTQLGVLLVQLPPSLGYNAASANKFFDDLGTRIDKHVGVACEPRHRACFTDEADALIRARKVAQAAVDPPLEGQRKMAFTLDLEPRSLYCMHGSALWDWQHAVSATKTLRYSITFRTLADKRTRPGRQDAVARNLYAQRQRLARARAKNL